MSNYSPEIFLECNSETLSGDDERMLQKITVDLSFIIEDTSEIDDAIVFKVLRYKEALYRVFLDHISQSHLGKHHPNIAVSQALQVQDLNTKNFFFAIGVAIDITLDV